MEPPRVHSSVSHENGLKPEERFESYRVAASPLCQADPIRGVAPEDARCSGWLVDDLLFCNTSFTPTLFRRDKKLAQNGNGLLLQFYGGGEQRGEVDGHPLYHGQDRVVIQDISRPYTAVGHVQENLGVLIPRHRLSESDRLFQDRPILSWPVTSPRGRILLQTLRTTIETLPDLHQSNAEIVASGFIGLLNGLVSTEQGLSDNEHVNAACRETMKQYIVQNLRDPDLSPAMLSKVFACSRAKIYRLLADDGGVAAFIRNQRLLKCFRELDLGEKGQTTVNQVAERWGFQDPYHFSKLFKNTFGVPPSGVLVGQSHGSEGLVAPADRFGGGTIIREWVSSF